MSGNVPPVMPPPLPAHARRPRAALAHLPDIDPAIAALALWCQHRDSTGTTRTDGDTIHYGPGYDLRPLPEQVGILAHHVLHVALRHSHRRAAMAQRLGSRFAGDLYDMACDGLVNEALLRGGHVLPRPVLRARDLVARLPTEAQPRDVLTDWDCDQLYFALVACDASRRVSGDTEASDTLRAYAARQGFDPDIGDGAPDSTDAEIWSGRVGQALAAGRNAGSGIGAALTRFGDLPSSTVPWEVHLRRRMQRAFAQVPRQSHRRPSRDWLAREALARRDGGPDPVFTPGTVRDGRRPRLVVGLDTSSSITDDELALFAAEALALVRRAGAEAHLLGFDTEVHHRARLDRRETLRALEMRRGGGTDFAAILEEAQSLQPSLIVMLTDLDAPPVAAPRAPVIWAVPWVPRKVPPFGELVVMRGEKSGSYSDAPDADRRKL